MNSINENEYNKHRLELFNFNNENIKKICLSGEDKQTITAQYVEKLGDTIDKEIFNSFIESIDGEFNENLALVILPHFSQQFINNQKIFATEMDNGSIHFKKDQFGFMIEEFELIDDFLKQPTGSIVKENGAFKIWRYGDSLRKSIRRALELNYNLIEKNSKTAPTRKMSLFVDELKDKMLDFITDVYLNQIKKENIQNLFKLYNIRKEIKKFEQAQEDNELFKEQFKSFNQFVKSLKNNTEKDIIIKIKPPLSDHVESSEFAINGDNNVYTSDKKSGEDIFEFTINKAIYDFKATSSIIVQERTDIYNSNNEPQIKVCGLLIKEGEFIPIQKEQLKEMYQQVINVNMFEDRNNYRFFDWFYNYIPNFYK